MKWVCLHIDFNEEVIMMRPIYILCTAMVMLLLPCATYADDYQDCKSSCTAERDTSNANCPSPYDTSKQQHSECTKGNQSAYESCVTQCPATTPPPSPTSEQQPAAPPAMGY